MSQHGRVCQRGSIHVFLSGISEHRRVVTALQSLQLKVKHIQASVIHSTLFEHATGIKAR